jgi:hypothetical protein
MFIPKGFILSTGLLALIVVQANHLTNQIHIWHQINELNSTPQTKCSNGPIKEEDIFNNGSVKIFRTFDEHGKQVFNQAVDLQCIDSK